MPLVAAFTSLYALGQQAMEYKKQWDHLSPDDQSKVSKQLQLVVEDLRGVQTWLVSHGGLLGVKAKQLIDKLLADLDHASEERKVAKLETKLKTRHRELEATVRSLAEALDQLPKQREQPLVAILQRLFDAGGALPAKDLADELSLHPSALERTIDQPRSLGLISSKGLVRKTVVATGLDTPARHIQQRLEADLAARGVVSLRPYFTGSRLATSTAGAVNVALLDGGVRWFGDDKVWLSTSRLETRLRLAATELEHVASDLEQPAPAETEQTVAEPAPEIPQRQPIENPELKVLAANLKSSVMALGLAIEQARGGRSVDNDRGDLVDPPQPPDPGLTGPPPPPPDGELGGSPNSQRGPMIPEYEALDHWRDAVDDKLITMTDFDRIKFFYTEVEPGEDTESPVKTIENLQARYKSIGRTMDHEEYESFKKRQLARYSADVAG
jgi:hypothetical protein